MSLVHAYNPSTRTTELEVSSTDAYNPSTSTTELDVSSTHAYNPSTRTTELEVSSTDVQPVYEYYGIVRMRTTLLRVPQN